MKNFKIMDRTENTLENRGFKRLINEERNIDFSKTNYSKNYQEKLIDAFEDDLNAVIEDESGTLYEASLYYCDEEKKEIPVIYRKIARN